MSVWPRWLTFVILALGFLSAAVSGARAEIRSLKLYHLHTREKAEIVFKRNGRYDPEGLRKINIILRDWRRNEPTKMDPLLVDLVWEAYRESGATDYIQVVCGYRSPATNSMLRSRSKGVAEKSQHMLGKAMDFYIPGVPLKKLRNIGLKMQGGGVGYYPTSGSPFVHMDVGNVRHWPGISRQELVSLFPNGKTLHVPSDGMPLPGYQLALASYKSRKGAGSPAIELASAGGVSRKSSGLVAAFFDGGDGADDRANITSAAPAPTPKAEKPAVKKEDDNPAESWPQQDTPKTIMAALPAHSIRLPDFAQRSKAGTDQQPPENVPLGMADSQNVADAGAAYSTQVTVNNIPLPTWRPDRSLPADLVPRDNNLLLALADTAAHQTATDAFSVLSSARPDEVKAALEPANATSEASAMGSGYQVASLEPRSASIDPAGVGAASPRIITAARPVGSDPAQAIDSDVKTTRKQARASASDRRHDQMAVVLSANPRAASWALYGGENIATISNATTAPRYAYNIVQTAPSEVFTAGFQPSNHVVDANRFTGNAVRFLSVARFQTK